jgi:hypothetical protein
MRARFFFHALILTCTLLGCGPGQAASGGETAGESETDSESETGEQPGCSPGAPLWVRELEGASYAYVAGVLPDDSLLLSRDTDTSLVLERWSTDGDLVWSTSVGAWLQEAALADVITDGDRVFALAVTEQTLRLVRLDVDSGELAWQLEFPNEQPQKYGGRLAARSSTVMAGFESINLGNTNDRDWHVFRIDVDSEAVLWEGRPMIPGNRMDALALTPSGDALVVGALNDDSVLPEGFIRFAAADGAPSWFRPREEDLRIRKLAWSGAELHALQPVDEELFDILVYDESGALLRTLLAVTPVSSSATGMRADASGIVLGAWAYGGDGETFAGDLYAFQSDGALHWQLSETMDEPLTCGWPQLDSRGAVLCAVNRWSVEAQALVKVCR